MNFCQKYWYLFLTLYPEVKAHTPYTTYALPMCFTFQVPRGRRYYSSIC